MPNFFAFFNIFRTFAEILFNKVFATHEKNPCNAIPLSAGCHTQ